MRREKGIAYCGLACCVCGENETCIGCKEKGCKDVDTCEIHKCCTEKGIDGCYACVTPCHHEMLQKPRVKVFNQFMKAYGKESLMDCLEFNEKQGIQYHYRNELIGDYDQCVNEKAICTLLQSGIYK